MKKKQESFHQTTEEALAANRINNIGKETPPPEGDSIIRDAAAQEETADPKEESITGNEGETEKRHPEKSPSPREKKKAAVKLTLLSLLALIMIGVALAEDFPAAPQTTTETTRQITAQETVDNEPVTKSTPVSAEKTEPVSSNKETTVTEKTAENATPQTQSVNAETSSAFRWQLPDGGKLIRTYGYSYDKTWRDYRFHSGVDIALSTGSEVTAAADGTVTERGKTKALGEYLRIDYGNQLIGYYFGIALRSDLAAGSTVSVGQVLGTITEPPLEESAEVPHYHFGLIQDGQTIDPEKLLK